MRCNFVFLFVFIFISILPPAARAEASEVRGLFLASTGPRSEYAKTFWWEMDEAALTAYVEELHAGGFNELYPAAYGHGNYFFKTPNALYSGGVVPDRLAIDPLAVLIREAHKRDMKVIPFFPFLVAGGEPYVRQSAGGELPQPSWYCVDPEGEHGKSLSYDPANPEVRAYLMTLVEDLLAYDIDGLMLDYIRYLGSHMGYTPLARARFEDAHGADPLDLLYQPDAYSDKLVYCIRPKAWEGKPWYLSTLITALNDVRAPFKVVDEADFSAAAIPPKGTVLLGAWYDLPEALVTELHAFVAGGGHVVFLDAPTTAMKNHEATLGAILGMTQASRYAGQQVRTLQVAAEHPITAGVVAAEVYCSANALTTITPESATVLARFADERPAVVLNSLGEGHSVLFNFNLLLNYLGDSGIELLGNTLRWTLVQGGDDPGAARLADLNAAWTQWRCDQVTEVVGMVRDVVEAKRPGLLVGAAVTPQRLNVTTVFQEWKTWIKRDYIDVVYPMDYFGEDHALRVALKWQRDGIDVKRIVPLLALYRREGGKTVPVTRETLLRQVQLLEAEGFPGTGLFSNQRYAPELAEILSAYWGG